MINKRARVAKMTPKITLRFVGEKEEAFMLTPRIR